MGTAEGSLDETPDDVPVDVLVGPSETRVERALDLAARWFVGYGIVSLAVAAVVLLLTVVVAIRLGGSGDRLVERVARIGITLDSTAAALDEAVASAGRFETSLDELGPTLVRTTDALRSGSGTLTELATAAERISLLGSRPFASLATSLTTTAGTLDGLATSLDGNAATLEGSATAIERMKVVLPPVTASLRDLRTDLEPDVQAMVDDLGRLVPLAGAGFALWLAVPGVGALLLGRRIRRALRE